MSETVSIIIPVHNAEAYIRKTVLSVMEQTYHDWELILVENGSEDGSAELLKTLENEKIHVFTPKEAGSAASARNYGVKQAKGNYIAFLDADDIWQKDKLEKQIAFMKEKGAAFSFTGYEFGDEEANPTGKIVHVPGEITYKKALNNTTIFTSTVMFDVSLYPKSEIQMPDIKSEDTALWWKVLKSGVTGYGLDENLVTYRRPRKSLSSNKMEAIRRIWNLYRKYEHFNVIKSSFLMIGWGVRAVKRRI